MKTVTCVVLFGTMFLMVGGRCLASDTGKDTAPTAKTEMVADLGAARGNDQMRVWIDSIKPSAGHIEPVHKTTSYWDKSVRREKLSE